MNNNSITEITFGKIVLTVFSIFTAFVAYEVNANAHSSWPTFWSIVDFFIPFFAWIKWFIYEEVSMSVIRDAFAFFLK